MRKNIRSIIVQGALVFFLVTACTPAGNNPTSSEAAAAEDPAVEQESAGDLETVEPSPTQEPEVEETAAVADEINETEAPRKYTPTWFDIPMVDARTGESFTINDYRDKVVLVEMLAMWCPKCLNQQIEVKALHERLEGEDDFISIGLDIDINEDAQDLKTYVENNQFDWLYAIAPVEVAREISELYGAQFLNPPSTPILVIDKGGEVHLMNFGIKTADVLFNFVAPFLAE